MMVPWGVLAVRPVSVQGLLMTGVSLIALAQTKAAPRMIGTSVMSIYRQAAESTTLRAADALAIERSSAVPRLLEISRHPICRDASASIPLTQTSIITPIWSGPPPANAVSAGIVIARKREA